MKSSYETWLEQQGYAAGTVQAQMHRAGRVEDCYGNLDEHYDRDQLRSVIGELKYSTADERRNKPNPSKIPFNGNTRNNLASYRNAVERYCKFRRETRDDDIGPGIRASNAEPMGASVDDRGQLIGLERDLQAALRRAIEQLEPGMEIFDDGAERSVASGFIDITAQDTQGAIVVIELLIHRIAQKQSQIVERDVERAVKTVLDQMAACLAGGGRIEIRGFGGFLLRFRRARVGRKPGTGTPVSVRARYAPYFKPGKKLGERHGRLPPGHAQQLRR